MLNDDAVVITGLGLLTPIGIGKTRFWNALIAGENGIRDITSFDTSEFRTHRGGEIRGFEPAQYCRTVNHRRVGRGAQLAVAAARLAFEDAGVDPGKTDPARTAVIFGTTMGESPIAESIDSMLVRSSKLCAGRRPSRDASLSFPQEMISCSIAREFGIRGPVSLMATACAAGNYAIGYAADLLQSGEVDLALAGGSDPSPAWPSPASIPFLPWRPKSVSPSTEAGGACPSVKVRRLFCSSVTLQHDAAALPSTLAWRATGSATTPTT